MTAPTCSICTKPKRLHKHKRGFLCSRCIANLDILTTWLAPHRANIIVYLGRVP